MLVFGVSHFYTVFGLGCGNLIKVGQDFPTRWFVQLRVLLPRHSLAPQLLKVGQDFLLITAYWLALAAQNGLVGFVWRLREREGHRDAEQVPLRDAVQVARRSHAAGCRTPACSSRTPIGWRSMTARIGGSPRRELCCWSAGRRVPAGTNQPQSQSKKKARKGSAGSTAREVQSVQRQGQGKAVQAVRAEQGQQCRQCEGKTGQYEAGADTTKTQPLFFLGGISYKN